MNEYFKLLRNYHSNNTIQPFCVYYVLNNTSCDLDSFVSAILLSIGKNYTVSPMFQNDIINGKIFFPLMNCKRGELSYRLDIKFILDYFKIDESLLFYVSDFQNENFKNRKFILVDHNLMDTKFTDLSDTVEEIYDHHFDSDSTSNIYKNLKRKFIKYPIASCSTLILLDFFIQRNGNKYSFIDPIFMISAVLIDSENFSEKLYNTRWVELDFFVYRTLVDNFVSDSSVKDFYNNLICAKFDVSSNLNLGIETLMNKDKKIFNYDKYIIEWSSLTIPFKKISSAYNSEEFYNYIQKKCTENKSDFYITISYYNDEISSKLVILYDINNRIDDVCMLENFFNLKLLEKFKKCKRSKKAFKCFKIFIDSSLSRKLLDPIFKEYFTYL